MNATPTYAFSSWVFKRAIALIYVIAFVSLALQVRGLWGEHGILPIGQYLESLQLEQGSTVASRFLGAPSLFWISASDTTLVAAAWLGALAGGIALCGWAEGWTFLLCYILYLSFCAVGQKFMRFQGDHLLLEVGLLTLFAIPWQFANSFFFISEPRRGLRLLFYLVLFKLMFLSGLAKLLSGDQTWRDLTALSYHYWTQPLPNPLSPFMYALPLWVHRFSTLVMFVIELGFPFLLWWPRFRVVAASGFIALSLMIATTGNFMFFNWLTIALCLWLIPERHWRRLDDQLKVRIISRPQAPSLVLSVCAVIMALMSVLWITRRIQPHVLESTLSPVYLVTKNLGMSYSYGLFPTMTTSRPEVVIEGSEDGKIWKEYEFPNRPGPLDRAPPVVAPFHPRLEWELWFAGPAKYHPNPWFDNLMTLILDGSPDVLAFLSKNPFPNGPPRYLRASRYEYEFNRPGEIFSTGRWWRRRYLNQFSPIYPLPKL